MNDNSLISLLHSHNAGHLHNIVSLEVVSIENEDLLSGCRMIEIKDRNGKTIHQLLTESVQGGKENEKCVFSFSLFPFSPFYHICFRICERPNEDDASSLSIFHIIIEFKGILQFVKRNYGKNYYVD